MVVATVEAQIRAFNASYANCIDNDQLEAWPDFFTENCVYKISNTESVAAGLPVGIVFANSKGMLQDRVSALREANIYEAQHYRHILSLPDILACTESSAQVRLSFMVVRTTRNARSELFASGYYDDRMVKEDNGWKLSQRIVVCDSSVIDTLLAIPL